MIQRRLFALAVLTLIAAPALAGEKEIAAALGTIKAVGKEGEGNDAAAAAWKSLTKEGQPALLPTLTAFQGANATAGNWLRSAVDAIVEAEAKADRKLSADALRKFFLDVQQSPDARRIAFEFFEKLQPDAAKELIARLIDDPSLDLRRDAIARSIENVGNDKQSLEPLFTAARDRDQIEDLAKRLGKPKSDIVKHFNIITRWHVVGPFDGPNASGFATKYEPENGVDLKAAYDGKGGKKVSWKTAATKDIDSNFLKEIQLIDLTEEIGRIKDAVAYGYAVVEVDKDAAVDIRAATQNGVKIFVNGKSIFEREAYHQGTSLDQHSGQCKLKAGKNEILVKVCQNDQKEPWAQAWAFHARICDDTGGAVPFKLVSPAAEGQ
jgi:hypothetical protein